jgi:hypothetical protein
MNKVQNIVAELQDKAKKIVNLHHKHEEEILALRKEILELQQTLEKQKKQIITLEEKVKINKITSALESSKDTFNAKIKINEIVREIDKCIALLNN